MGRKSNINETQVLNTFKVLNNTRQTAEQLNIKIHQVQWILYKYNLHPTPQVGHRLYQCDHLYFDHIDTEEKAYWLGFLYADGNINDTDKTGSKRLQVALSDKDIKHLEQFKRALNSSHPIHQRIINSGKMQGKTYCKFSIRSNELCNSLISHGCTPRKSLTLRFPNLSKELISHFIRGYFDGDGSVFISKEKHWRNGKIFPVLHFRFMGTYEFLKIVDKELNLTGRISQPKGNKAFELSYKRNKKAIAFYKYLYKDATVYLKRKQQIFASHIQERCSETTINQLNRVEGIVQI